MTEPQRLEEADLDAYLRRIGYRGEARPNLATLNAIHYGNATSIAFENLTPLLRQPVRLDLLARLEKLVYGGRERQLHGGVRLRRRAPAQAAG